MWVECETDVTVSVLMLQAAEADLKDARDRLEELASKEKLVSKAKEFQLSSLTTEQHIGILRQKREVHLLTW